MNRDLIRDGWSAIGDKVRRRWSKLTEDDLVYPGGSAAYLVGVLQDRYQLDRPEALLQVHEFEIELSADSAPPDLRALQRTTETAAS